MSESQNQADPANTANGAAADQNAIASLVADLSSKDWVVRQRARKFLVSIGGPAVPTLVEVLGASNDSVRWEAAKTLRSICDPAAAAALVEALEDEEFGVSWLAADGLIAMGREGLAPLLEALKQRPDSVRLRRSAHHILRSLRRIGLEGLVSPVLTALDDIEPTVEVPWAAETALAKLGKGIANQSGLLQDQPSESE